jgi:hypothetical protein
MRDIRVDSLVEAYCSRSFCSMTCGSLVCLETTLNGLSPKPLTIIATALRFCYSVGMRTILPSRILYMVADEYSLIHTERSFDSRIARSLNFQRR